MAEQVLPRIYVCSSQTASTGSEYHSIMDADKDGTKPIMWHVKLVEGKDWLKKADGMFAFPSQYEKKGHSPTVTLLLEMMVCTFTHVSPLIIVRFNPF